MFTKFNRSNLSTFGLIAAITMLSVGSAYAGTGGTEFDTVWTTLTDWSQGTLGKIIALGLVMTGLGMGVVRQSIMAVVVGISCGLSLFNAPVIVENIVGAVL